MPSIGRIQSTNFQALLTELGIVRNNIPFDLRSEVSPVVLVGGTVSFVAAPTPAYGVTDIFTAGVQVAPAAGFLLADTGPLPVGAYTVLFYFNATESAQIELRWRDAADAANLWLHETIMIIGSAGGPCFQQLLVRFNIVNANERFTVVNRNAGAALTRYQASILAKI